MCVNAHLYTYVCDMCTYAHVCIFMLHINVCDICVYVLSISNLDGV